MFIQLTYAKSETCMKGLTKPTNTSYRHIFILLFHSPLTVVYFTGFSVISQMGRRYVLMLLQSQHQILSSWKYMMIEETLSISI